VNETTQMTERGVPVLVREGHATSFARVSAKQGG
jgi:hypothetical protein